MYFLLHSSHIVDIGSLAINQFDWNVLLPANCISYKSWNSLVVTCDVSICLYKGTKCKIKNEINENHA